MTYGHTYECKMFSIRAAQPRGPNKLLMNLQLRQAQQRLQQQRQGAQRLHEDGEHRRRQQQQQQQQQQQLSLKPGVVVVEVVVVLVGVLVVLVLVLVLVVAGEPGHFLLLSPSPAAEDSGSCDHHLTSPVLPGSGELCSLQLAVFRSGPALGNLTLLVQRAASSGAPLGSTVIQQRHTRGRAAWEVVDAAIGQVDEPFRVTLLYSSCLNSSGATLALDSLEFLDCEMEPPHGLDLGSRCQGAFHCDHLICIDQSQVCDFHTDCPLGEDEGYICDGLPSGSHCSFERDVCGWSVSNQHAAWRRVTGQQMMEREGDDPPGDVLRRTPGHFLVLRLRFSLYVSGEFNGTLTVFVEENGTTAVPVPVQGCCPWADDWQTVTLDLTGLRRQFSIKMSAAWGPGSAPAVIALDDITLGACFDAEVSLMTWWFTSCGASGPRGPTQAQCDSAYRNTNVSVTVGKEGSLKGVQIWRVPATNRYIGTCIEGTPQDPQVDVIVGTPTLPASKHAPRVMSSSAMTAGAEPGPQAADILMLNLENNRQRTALARNPLTQKICLGESSVIEDPDLREDGAAEWAGGGGGGGGATYIFKMEDGEPVPLLIAAGGGGKAYLEDPDSGLDQIPLEQYENDTGVEAYSHLTGGGGGWQDGPTLHPRAGKSLVAGAEGGASCPPALSKLSWPTFGGFGGGGGACTAGGGGGGYRAMESHGECEIKVQLNCSHCETQSCTRDEDSHLLLCLCHNEESRSLGGGSTAPLTCTQHATPPWQTTHLHRGSRVATPVEEVYYRKKKQLHAVRLCLQSPEYKLSKIRSSTIMTDYNPNYCFAGKAASLSELKEVPRKNITLLRCVFGIIFTICGEVYEGQVLGMCGDKKAVHVAIKTLPELCSEQDEMDFLMEALIMSKFSHQNIVRCVGVSLHILPRFILLELMTGGDLKSFLRKNRPRAGQSSSLSMLELLHMARDIAYGCHYLEENHFIH
ncbi:hypothetical protein CRUP_018520, partial [Coryphaenoides rupestris]